MSLLLSWAVCAVFATFLVYGQTAKTPVPSLQPAAASKPAPTPSIGVFMDFDNAPGSAPLAVMKTEVQKLLKPSGLSLDWHMLGENRGRQPFSGLVVLKFKGKCRVEGWSLGPIEYGQEIGDETTLGFTDVVNGHVVPFSEVECDRIRDALAYLNPGAGRKERQKAFGVALARVVAHELYHVLAHTTTHAGTGLAKASETLQDLVTKPQMSFDPGASRAMSKGFTALSGQ